jgi:hypothetical protein
MRRRRRRRRRRRKTISMYILANCTKRCFFMFRIWTIAMLGFASKFCQTPQGQKETRKKEITYTGGLRVGVRDAQIPARKQPTLLCMDPPTYTREASKN